MYKKAKELEKNKESLKKLEAKKKETEINIRIKTVDLRRYKIVRNLKIFGNVINFISPVLITASLYSVISYSYGFGLPIIRDEISSCKKYIYEEDLDGKINIEESYNGSFLNRYQYGKTEFNIYSNWEQNENSYERIVREYKFKDSKDIVLYNAAKVHDFEYIIDNYNPINEVKEVRNEIDNDTYLFDSDYKISGIITSIDPTDIYSYKENSKRNFKNTILFSIITVSLGSFFIKVRKYKLVKKIKENNREYEREAKKLEFYKNELVQINKQMDVLSKWVKKNEKRK